MGRSLDPGGGGMTTTTVHFPRALGTLAAVKRPPHFSSRLFSASFLSLSLSTPRALSLLQVSTCSGDSWERETPAIKREEDTTRPEWRAYLLKSFLKLRYWILNTETENILCGVFLLILEFESPSPYFVYRFWKILSSASWDP